MSDRAPGGGWWRASGAAALLAGAALLLLPALGLYPLFDVDEGAFSEATREMLQGGDWLSTTLNGAPRFDKPILIYWLQALSVRAFGLNEFALRLPSALATLGWVLAVVAFVAPRWGATPARLAGWVTATSLGVLAMGRTATADALLNALLAALMFDLWRYFESGSRPALRRTYFWVALGVLTKGPIAILIPAAVGLLYGASARRWREALRAGTDPLGWLILLVVAGPWYAAQLALHGQAFVDGFLLRHNVERFQGTLEGHSGSLLYYFLVVPVLALPWSALLWQAARRLGADWGEPAGRYLILWFAFVFVFFSLSGTKLPHYVLYGMTPVFILLARALAAGAGGRGALLATAALALVLPAVPLAVDQISQGTATASTAFYFSQARRSLALAGAAYYGITIAAALACLGLVLVGRWTLAHRAVAASVALAGALGFAFVPWLGEMLSGPVRDAGRFGLLHAGDTPAATVQWNITAPSFSVYRQAVTPARPPEPGELALTRLDRLAPGTPVDILFQEGAIALVRRQAAPGPTAQTQ